MELSLVDVFFLRVIIFRYSEVWHVRGENGLLQIGKLTGVIQVPAMRISELWIHWIQRTEVLHPGAPQFIYLLHEAARKAVIDVAGSCFRIDVWHWVFSVGGRIVKRRESTLGTTCWST